MKIEFDHIEGWGKITQHDLIHAPCWVIPEQESPDDMLESGFLPWGGRWFPARSVRYDLEKMNFRRTTVKNSAKVTWIESKPADEHYDRIVKAYVEFRKFDSAHVFEELKNNQDFNWLTYKHAAELVAFLAFLRYERSFIGVQFAWDYATPGLSLGSVSTFVEALLARSCGCRWYYVMGGYENASAYKANHEGFQFWTGKEWSEDRKLYSELCVRDSRIEYSDGHS